LLHLLSEPFGVQLVILTNFTNMSKEIIKKAGREFEKEILPDGTVTVTLLPEKQMEKSEKEVKKKTEEEKK